MLCCAVYISVRWVSVRVGSTVWYLGGKGGNHFQIMLHKVYVYVCMDVCGFFLARMMSVAYDNINMIKLRRE